jgi:hypothetical protein
MDDMNGEYYSYLMERLLESGAKDVTYTSVYMKKNRPGVKVEVLVSEHLLETIEDILLTETTTFGVRKYPVSRKILNREQRTMVTPWGDVDIKIGYFEGEILKVTPEYESLKSLAESLKIPLPKIYSDIQLWISKELKSNRL